MPVFFVAFSICIFVFPLSFMHFEIATVEQSHFNCFVFFPTKHLCCAWLSRQTGFFSFYLFWLRFYNGVTNAFCCQFVLDLLLVTLYNIKNNLEGFSCKNQFNNFIHTATTCKLHIFCSFPIFVGRLSFALCFLPKLVVEASIKSFARSECWNCNKLAMPTLPSKNFPLGYFCNRCLNVACRQT